MPLAALLLLSAPCQADDIYKYVDRDGTVTYSSFKPRGIAYEKFEPNCIYTYLGCALSNSDWNRVPLNHAAYKEQISAAARRHGVDAALIRAVVHAESNFNHRAVSRAGAQGLMQLMPQTQDKLGVSNPYHIVENIDAGTRLLKSLLRRYGSVRMAAAAYNAGPDAVERYQGIPPYKETNNYVRRVSLLYTRYKETM